MPVLQDWNQPLLVVGRLFLLVSETWPPLDWGRGNSQLLTVDVSSQLCFELEGLAAAAGKWSFESQSVGPAH